MPKPRTWNIDAWSVLLPSTLLQEFFSPMAKSIRNNTSGGQVVTINGRHGSSTEATSVSFEGSYGFSNVDLSQDPRSFITYLDSANTNDQMRFCKQQLFGRLLRPQKGEYLLDVGCGLGHDALTLSRLVGPKGRIVGVDRSMTMIGEAKRRAVGSYVGLEFLVCDVHYLEFANHTFDGCLVVNTLMHVEDPQVALAEIVRVLKPGGRLVALEPDWDTLVMFAGKPITSNGIVKILRRSVRHSGVGHHLPVLFKQVGLKDIVVETGTFMASDYALAANAWRIEANVEEARRAGVVSSIQSKKLLRELRLASENNRFFMASTGFAVFGRKLRP
jgi:ubiquinone/menaquinone biosynthesis C-methylase UbiE